MNPLRLGLGFIETDLTHDFATDVKLLHSFDSFDSLPPRREENAHRDARLAREMRRLIGLVLWKPSAFLTITLTLTR